MALTQADAETLGWVFHTALEGDPGASKRVGNDLIQKSHAALDTLLGDIDAWENHHVRNTAAAEAGPEPAPAPVVLEEGSPSEEPAAENGEAV